MNEITLIVRYKIKNGKMQNFLSALKDEGFPEVVQGENGCIAYDYFVPAFGGQNEVLLVEKWQSEKLQKAHLATPHMQKMKAFKDDYVADTSVEIFK